MFDTENVGPPVKPPRKYQVLEMSQSLGNEIKVKIKEVIIPVKHLTQCLYIVTMVSNNLKIPRFAMLILLTLVNNPGCSF